MKPKESDLLSSENPKLNSDKPFLFQVILLVLFFLVLWSLNYITFYLGINRALLKLHDLFYNLFGLNVLDFTFDSSTQRSPFLSSSLLIGSLNRPVILVGLFLNSVFVFWNYNTLRWRNFESGSNLKYFIFFIAFILAWAYSTYDYNLYLNQAHYFDRFFLVFSAGLILIHPAFTTLFVPVLLIVISQFNYPLIHFSINDKFLPCNMLLAFIAFMHLVGLTKILNRKFARSEELLQGGKNKITKAILYFFPVNLIDVKIKWKIFLYLILCICASFYFVPGLKKLWISPHIYEWLFFNELQMHTLWKMDMGWLAFLDEVTKQQIFEWVKDFNKFMMVGATGLEIFAIFILYNRKLNIFFLLSFCALHLMIFAESGILFWKWILVDIALVALLLSLKQKPFEDVFNRKYFVLSVLVILFSIFYFRPTPLGWWDTRNYFKFQVEGVGESGKTYRIQDSFMDPFHMLFIFQRYDYILDEKLLHPPGSTADFQYFNAVKNAGKDGLPVLKEKLGRNSYDEERAEQFDEFIKTFFKNLNHRMDKDVIFSYFPTPHHVYFDDFFHEPPDVYNLQEKLILIKIRFKEYYYEENKVVVIQDKIARNIAIP